MRILYTTDGSPQARAAGVLLAGLNLSPEDHITVFTVDDRRRDIEGIFQSALEDLAGTSAGVETKKGKGDAHEGILGKCRTSAPDLLVLGAKGESLGREAKRALRHAPCSVLVGKRKTSSIRNVLLAFDGTPPSLSAAETLLSFPLSPQSRIHLVTVLAPLSPALPQRVPVYLRNGLEELQVLRDLSRLRRDFLTADRPAKIHTVRGEPAACLLSYAQSENIDLVVLGFHGAGLSERILRFVIGSVSEKVARKAPCSILLPRK